MSSLVKKQAPLLHLLVTAKPFLRKDILKSASSRLILSIVECAFNVLNGRINLNKSQKQELLKHKTLLRNIVKNKRKVNKRKILVNQSGGAFLPALLLPVLSSLLASSISSR